MRVIPVSPETMDTAWPHAAPWLEKAAFRGHSAYPLEDVRADIEADKKRLYKLLSGDAFVWLVIGLAQNSRARRCVVHMLGGAGLKGMLPQVVEFCEAYARWNGAASISCAGRAGWVRELAPFGWTETGRVCGKELQHG